MDAVKSGASSFLNSSSAKTPFPSRSFQKNATLGCVRFTARVPGFEDDRINLVLLPGRVFIDRSPLFGQPPRSSTARTRFVGVPGRRHEVENLSTACEAAVS